MSNVCPFHEFKLQFHFEISFFAFTFVFNNHKKVIVEEISRYVELRWQVKDLLFHDELFKQYLFFLYRS